MSVTPRSHERFYRMALDQVASEWGLMAWDKVGLRIYRALFMEKIVELAAGQDDSVSDSKVRLMIEFAPEYIDGVIKRAKDLPS